MSKITRMGIDLVKNTFHVCAMDRSGRVVLEKRFTRRGLEKFVRAHEPCVVGMEACEGAHHWARELRAMGYDARLMSAQFVKAYVKSNKNDWRDAEAICEAVGRPTMRFVPVKTVEQQSLQHLHRARSMAVSQRTALANQTRGFAVRVRAGARARDWDVASRGAGVGGGCRQRVAHGDARVAGQRARGAGMAR